MLDVVTLIKRKDGVDVSARDVFCGIRSVGRAEFYEAHAQDIHPELVIVLADYMDYMDENLVEHNGQRYRVLRTYRTGLALELTVERAAAEDGGVYG